MKKKYIIIIILFSCCIVLLRFYDEYRYSGFDLFSFALLSSMLAGPLILFYQLIVEIDKREDLGKKDKLFWTIILISTNFFGLAFYIAMGDERIFKE